MHAEAGTNLAMLGLPVESLYGRSFEAFAPDAANKVSAAFASVPPDRAEAPSAQLKLGPVVEVAGDYQG